MIKKALIGGLALAIVSIATIPVQAAPGSMGSMNDHAMYQTQTQNQMQHRQMIQDGNMTGCQMAGNMTQACNQAMVRTTCMDDVNGTCGRNLRMGLGPQHYGPFDVDISQDPFVNPRAYMRLTGMQFVDENGDGICDMVQDSEMFRSLGVGPCVDENEDSICDCFQTRDAYQRLGMHNFVDVDGDGICDNYEMNPFMNSSN
ncbi:MAG: hypothetical protein GXO58_01565 [Thermodesulfobacteria bacterium]|nr:hypothetical protein [Thermodesulfobacteriota bacterium]